MSTTKQTDELGISILQDVVLLTSSLVEAPVRKL